MSRRTRSSRRIWRYISRGRKRSERYRRLYTYRRRRKLNRQNRSKSKFWQGVRTLKGTCNSKTERRTGLWVSKGR